jgi:hypothetical protein
MRFQPYRPTVSLFGWAFWWLLLPISPGLFPSNPKKNKSNKKSHDPEKFPIMAFAFAILPAV